MENVGSVRLTKIVLRWHVQPVRHESARTLSAVLMTTVLTMNTVRMNTHARLAAMKTLTVWMVITYLALCARITLVQTLNVVLMMTVPAMNIVLMHMNVLLDAMKTLIA